MNPIAVRRGVGPVARRDALVFVALLVTAACVFVPFDPVMPELGLDPSWRFAINEFVARGFAFGSRIVFTYGPYASVFTGAWHPAVASLTFAATAWLAITYAVAVRTIAPRGTVAGPLLFCLLVAFLSTSRDALLLSSPLLATLATRVFARPPADRPARSLRLLAAAVVYSAAGLLVLVKGNLIIACGLSALLNAAFLARARRASMAVIAVAAPLATLLVFWSLAGQSPDGLLAYGSSALRMAAGYSAAMALFGDPQTVVEYGVGAALLVAAVAWGRRERRAMRAFVASSLLLYLFVAFKAAFVRHDGEHALIASGFLLAAAIASLIAMRTVAIAVATVACAGLWIAAELRYDPLFPALLAYRITTPFQGAIDAAANRWADPRWPRPAYDAAVARIAEARPLPALDGTADIYSFGQSSLIASGADWSPRPVFQSYAAYDEHLAALNAAWLAGANAPRNVLFAIEPIDRRLPALEDGASWPALLDGYDATGFDGRLLRLRRRAAVVPTRSVPLASSRHAIGEVVPVPDTAGRLYLALDLQATASGRWQSMLFKTSALRIDVELVDGSSHAFLLLPSMARSPFLLSPLVEDTADFASLFDRTRADGGKRVRSFRLSALRDGDAAWATAYGVAFESRAPVAP